jgi:hypothetical protein
MRSVGRSNRGARRTDTRHANLGGCVTTEPYPSRRASPLLGSTLSANGESCRMCRASSQLSRPGRRWQILTLERQGRTSCEVPFRTMRSSALVPLHSALPKNTTNTIPTQRLARSVSPPRSRAWSRALWIVDDRSWWASWLAWRMEEARESNAGRGLRSRAPGRDGSKCLRSATHGARQPLLLPRNAT